MQDFMGSTELYRRMRVLPTIRNCAYETPKYPPNPTIMPELSTLMSRDPNFCGIEGIYFARIIVGAEILSFN